MSTKKVEEIDHVAIRFAGDSGDGMQLTGSKFTETTALAGNDLSTFPDYPAEIRAPAGTLAGVSGFQVHFSSSEIFTPADNPDVLVAMNPASLKANLKDLRPNGTIILNGDAFSQKNLEKAGYTEDPRGPLATQYKVVDIPLTTLTREAVADLGLSKPDADRCKNFFALGVMYWMYNRSLDVTEQWMNAKFKGEILEANRRALRNGYHFGEITELLPVSFVVPPAKIAAGTYRNISGNQATAWGIIAAGELMNTPVVLGAYPITPASDILHEIARYRNFGIKTVQAEDEIAAVGVAIGASYAGMLGVTTTSGPGYILKQEALGLAVMTELPLVVVDVQRAGPSTGLPTKTEQGDLLAALYGRNSDSPMPILAPATPGDCFYVMLEAFRIAVQYMTPVAVLSDGYLANSSEPWKVPSVEDLKKIEVQHPTDPATFRPYSRNEETLARPWAVPGTPGLEHRLGGIEKENISGTVSYVPENHDFMVRLRAEKVARVAKSIPPLKVEGPSRGKLLVVGWGSTHGAITAAIRQLHGEGCDVAHVHLRHLNPFPSDLGEILKNYEKILVPELNTGHLTLLLRAEYLVPAQCFSKVAGQPFRIGEIVNKIRAVLAEEK